MVMNDAMSLDRGSIWEYENNKSVRRRCLVVSNDNRKNDAYVLTVLINDDARTTSDVKVSIGGVCYFANVTMVGTSPRDSFIRKIAVATNEEMGRVDNVLRDALGLKESRMDILKTSAPTPAEDSTWKAKYEVVKELYDGLLYKIIGE